jgi:hypothetical protein
MADAFLDTLNAWDERRRKQQEDQAAASKNALYRQAGAMIASGDATGGRNALYRAGDFAMANTVGTNIEADRKRQAEALDKFTTGVGRLLDMGVPADQAWALGERVSGDLGIDPGALQRNRDAYLSNPKGFITFYNDAAKREKAEFAKASDGSYTAADPYTGKPLYQYQAPTADKYEQFDPEKEIRRIPGRPGSSAAPNTFANGEGPNARPPQGNTFANGEAPNADQTVAALTGMGARVTSAARTPEENARVGGVPNSYHLTTRGGVARDLVPPAGMSMAQFHQEVRRRLPAGWEAINEGDHIHIEPGPGGGRVAQAPSQPGAPELVRPARPKAAQSENAPSGFRWKPDGSLEPIPGGPADTISQGGKVTEGERTAGFLASRLADSLRNLTTISQSDPGARKPGILESVAKSAPFVGGEGQANIVRSSDRQQVIANQLDVLDAALTLGTGAAYTKEQLRNYQQVYFPGLTDKPETVRAKGQKLIALLEAAKIKAGRSAPPALDEAIAAARAQIAGTAAPAVQPRQPAQAQSTRAQGGIPTLSPQEAAKLPKGSRFRTTDGRVLVRQ